MFHFSFALLLAMKISCLWCRQNCPLNRLFDCLQLFPNFHAKTVIDPSRWLCYNNNLTIYARTFIVVFKSTALNDNILNIKLLD